MCVGTVTVVAIAGTERRLAEPVNVVANGAITALTDGLLVQVPEGYALPG